MEVLPVFITLQSTNEITMALSKMKKENLIKSVLKFLQHYYQLIMNCGVLFSYLQMLCHSYAICHYLYAVRSHVTLQMHFANSLF